MSNEPSQYVRPEVSDARVERLWAAVKEGRERRPQAWLRRLAFALTFAAAAGAASWLAFRPELKAPAPAVAVQGAQLETAGEELAVSLKDGSSVALSARTKVAVQSDQPSAVRLQLSRGELRCDVTHRDGRSFTVQAADVEVRVVGTRFTVKATPAPEATRVEVSVQQGLVEIRSARQPGLVTRIGAGQTFSQAAEATPVPAAAAVASERAPASESPKREVSKPVVTPASGPSARELFEKAGEHRRAGDAAAAARAYEELLRAHPSDARVGLAAFELGRLRMDRLGDPAGAIALLERAVASSLGPSFREDALARLVSAYAGQGNYAACGRARDRYLQSYPHGVHAAAVASRCGAR